MSTYSFLFSFLVLISLPSYARTLYTNTEYPAFDYVICDDEEGVKKLMEMRKSQIEQGLFTPYAPIPTVEEGCRKVNAKIKIKEVKFSLPNEVLIIPDISGNITCPWKPSQKCKEVFSPPAQYVKGSYKNEEKGIWVEDIYIEVGGDIEYIDPCTVELKETK